MEYTNFFIRSWDHWFWSHPHHSILPSNNTLTAASPNPGDPTHTVFALECHFIETQELNEFGTAFLLIVDTFKLVELARGLRGSTNLVWESWGPRLSRLLDMSERFEIQCSGSRVFTQRFLHDHNGDEAIEVFDFNPYARRNLHFLTTAEARLSHEINYQDSRMQGGGETPFTKRTAAQSATHYSQSETDENRSAFGKLEESTLR